MNYEPQSLEIWSDDVLLVVNKPPGLPSLPDGYNPDMPYWERSRAGLR
ncbi:MAG: hypothetical protein U9R58_12125 [Chloroflexota bacterium]|nr:hypothetical protein [Chloroflexota bacterium]